MYVYIYIYTYTYTGSTDTTGTGSGMLLQGGSYVTFADTTTGNYTIVIEKVRVTCNLYAILLFFSYLM